MRIPVVDDHERFERALRESEERFRSAVNNMVEGVYTLDSHGLVTHVNPSAEAMFGWTAAELLGKKMHDVTHYKHPDGTPFPSADCPGLQVRQSGIELREREDVFIRKDGSFFPVVFSASPLTQGGKIAGIVVSFRDDTKRREADEVLARQTADFIDRKQRDAELAKQSRLLDFSFNAVIVLGFEDRITYWNKGAEELYGWTREEALGQIIHTLLMTEFPESLDAITACLRREDRWQGELNHTSKDGQSITVLSRWALIRDPETNSESIMEINTDVTQTREVERQLQASVQTLEDRIAERTCELQNATDKLRELSGRLLQAQDEERRRLARELHDGVGQLLAAMNMNLTTLGEEKSKLSRDAREILDENAGLIEQASREIRTMSHLLHPPLLDEVGLESALLWYVDGFSERSKITVRLQLPQGFSQGLPRDLALSLFRIVQECLTNIHRHSGSPTALVRIERSPDEITLEVRDEGRGIPPALQSTISSGASSGVGLRGMRERIRQFGGRFQIRSGEDGTSITAVLPIPAPKEKATGLPDDDGRIVQAHTEMPRQDAAMILCIDDETEGLLARRLLLESAGFRVIEANSGEDGIRLFRSERVAVVILDYWMSGMKGTAVASELRRIDPAVPIIVLSGMSDLPGEAAGLVDQWIVKGSTRPEQLLNCVNALLDRRPV
jgi:PAS domain S-box-containing protein